MTYPSTTLFKKGVKQIYLRRSQFSKKRGGVRSGMSMLEDAIFILPLSYGTELSTVKIFLIEIIQNFRFFRKSFSYQ